MEGRETEGKERKEGGRWGGGRDREKEGGRERMKGRRGER